METWRRLRGVDEEANCYGVLTTRRWEPEPPAGFEPALPACKAKYAFLCITRKGCYVFDRGE